MVRRRTTTVQGLLDAALRRDLPDFIAERRVNGPEELYSPAERMLQELHERGLVVWDDALMDVQITEAGKAHLAQLKARGA